MDEWLKDQAVYTYAVEVTEDKFPSNKDIQIMAQNFLRDLTASEDEDYKFFFDIKLAQKITMLTKLINMASGIKQGTPVHDSLAPFQWFFIMNVLCWKYKDEPEKRRYEQSILLIARKSGKTFLVALLFILLLLIEPEYSEFYSVAPDRELSSIVKKEMEQQIEKSPLISKHFQIVRGEVRCLLTKSKFVPLATSENRMDGRKANVFVADEVGALRSRYPIDAMKSSQMNMVNRTGILISTAYESLNNPMTEEVDYATKVIHGDVEDEKLFAMLYRPDDNKKWTDDDELLKANPLAIDIEENFDYLKEQRKKAIELPSAQKNFKTKHMNIFVDGDDSEVYIKTEDLRKNKLDGKYNWNGKEVYLGVDLAQSGDNTAVAMVHYDTYRDKMILKSWAFIPADSVFHKSKVEKIDYEMMIENGYAFASGDRIVSYRFIEDFVMKIEKEYGVKILGIGYDKWNAISSVNRWKDEGGLDVIEVKQHSSTLHAPTKLLKEYVIQEKVEYESNSLFERNVANAREVFDANMNSYVNKKKSTGKIDMLAATINAVALWNTEIEEGKSAYETRGIYIL